jgi:hypothetical protein
MRFTIRTRIRLAICAVCALIALAGGLGDGATPAVADGPGVSFSIDLNLGQSGIQAARDVPLDTPFSIAIVLDASDLAGYIEADATVVWDDVRVTYPPSGLPLDWSDPPEPGPIGGRLMPWTDPIECPPFDAQDAIVGEDGVGTAFVNVACVSSIAPATPQTYIGPLFEFVLVCDIAGPASIAINNGSPWTFILDPDFNEHNGHVHNAVVQCGSGTGDTDADGMPDAYENAHPCLNAAVADASANPDVDGKTNAEEFGIGTDPCDNDTDNDGCADGEELGPTALAGGLRNPLNQWDFYDVNATKKVDSADIAHVRSRFNGNGPTPLADAPYDRSSGVAPWAPGPPDNKINAVDIALVRYAFNHSCIPPP